jgi:CO/xanthine dehydrogenase FAD-binding subunit
MIVDYLTPRTLDEATAALAKQPDQSAVIAGGTEAFGYLQ